MRKAKRTPEQKAVLESARKLAPSKRPRGDACAPVPTPRSPRARRFPPHSGAWIAPPPHRCTRNGRCSWYRCSGRRDGDWWKSRHSTSTSLTSPACREATAAALPPDACTDAPVHRCARARLHARTPAQLAADCAVGQAAATASEAQIEHSTSAAQQPTAQVWPLSAGRCARPTHAHAHARPAFDPAAAAARP